MKSCCNPIDKLKKAIEDADAIVIGAGAGLSTAAGFAYEGERFERTFKDFEEAYGFHDMYTGGFYPYESLEEFWGYWSRYIYINRYVDAPKDTYARLYDLIKDKDYFVLTTNVDHCFLKAGFDKQRLFYTQGDYGLLQCAAPCHHETYDNEEIILAMVEQQKQRKIPSELIPRCPKCGKPMTTNLRADDTFVEDAGWNRAYERYAQFLERHKGMKVLFWELGVGYNTPIIIKYPFWKMTLDNKQALYACINISETLVLPYLEDQAILIQDDIHETLKLLKR